MTIVIGKRYLRCPKIGKIIEHLDCHTCPEMGSIRLGAWSGNKIRRAERDLYVSCRFKGTRKSILTASPGDTERLSNL